MNIVLFFKSCMMVEMFKRQIPSTPLSLWKHQRRIFTSHELYQNRGRGGSRPILVALHLSTNDNFLKREGLKNGNLKWHLP